MLTLSSAFLFITSCGNSLETDARKWAKIACKYEKLVAIPNPTVDDQMAMQKMLVDIQKIKDRHLKDIRQLEDAAAVAMGNCK